MTEARKGRRRRLGRERVGERERQERMGRKEKKMKLKKQATQDVCRQVVERFFNRVKRRFLLS
jgi:hypothetical protein